MSRLTPDENQKGVLMQCVFRSNFALIGVPLAELIAGSEGVTAAAILSAFTILNKYISILNINKQYI